MSTRLGAAGWIAAAVQFFVLMVVVELAWETPYSWRFSNISDLGNVHCGQFEGRYVCSPLHDVMNVSFTLGGILIIGGTLLTDAAWPRTSSSRLTRSLLVATGAGWMVAGLAPADVHLELHVLGGAVPIFLAGNLALLLTALIRTGPISRTRPLAVLFGVVGLVAMVLHFTKQAPLLGPAGMERVTAYTIPVWLVLTGLYLLKKPATTSARAGLHRAG